MDETSKNMIAGFERPDDPYIYMVVFLHDDAVEEIADRVVEKLKTSGVEQSGSSQGS